jgi:hypothetical protein
VKADANGATRAGSGPAGAETDAQEADPEASADGRVRPVSGPARGTTPE